jgi:CheY-like chemotaxis protein
MGARIEECGLLTELLEGKGLVPLAVADGTEALDVLHGGVRPAVILLDLMLPRMDGWGFGVSR